MKTFQHELAETLIKRHDNLSDLVVLFPSLRARTFFNHAISALVDKPVWQPSWTTIDELMEQGSGLKRGERIRLIAELHKVYVKYHPHETLDRFYFWGDMLIADFDKIDKYLIDASQLLQNVTDIKEIEVKMGDYLTPEQEHILSFWSSVSPEKTITEQKRLFLDIWRTLPAIYEEYRNNLIKLGIGYPGLLYRITAECIAQGNDIKLPNKKFIIAGFNALSKSEEVLFKALTRTEHGAEFYWDYDNYYVKNDEYEAGLFMRSNIVKFPSTVEISNNNFHDIKKRVRTTACVSNIVQIKHLSNIVDELAKREPLDKNTAIVLTDENLLVPLLHSLPESIKSVNVTMGYPLKATPAYTFIDRLIGLQSRCRTSAEDTLFYHADVTGLLSHPYIADACAGKSNTSNAQYISHIGTNRIVMVPAKIFQDHDVLCNIFASKVNDWRRLSKFILDTLELILASRNINDKATIEYLHIAIDEIRKIVLSIDNCDIEISVEIFTSLIKRHLQSVTIPFEGEPIEGVQIMGILETRNLDFKNVILLSMTDANFPGDRTEQASFIPYSLRFAYGLPTHKEHEAMYAYYFYRLIQRAENIEMLYCSRADDKSTGERSRYISQLEYEFNECNMEKLSVGVDLGIQTSAPIEIHKGEHEISILNKYLTEGSGYQLSPTALFKYIQCPLKFYFSTIANLKTPKEVMETIDPLTFGSILHNTLDKLYTDILNKKHPNADIAKLRDKAKVEDIMNKQISKLLYGDENADPANFTGDTRLVRDIILKYLLRGVMRYDEEERQNYTIIDLEKTVSYLYPISNNRFVSLEGRADRIDMLDDGTLQVIDYKSGNNEHIKFNNIHSLFHGEAQERIDNIFQTLLYSVILFHGRGKDVVPSLYFALKMINKGYNPNIRYMNGDGQETILERYSSVAEEFEGELTAIFEDLFNPEIPFKQADDVATCKYCDYKKICRR